MRIVRRWLRRLGIAIVALFVVVTFAAFAYDAATNGRVAAARSLYAGPYVEADGTQLAYRTWGRRGPPVVLLGGFAEASWIWHAVGPLLAAHHRVLALDLPPFGYSQRRGPYDLAHWAALVRAFDARLHVVRPLVVGHSLGAAVAVEDALERPAAVAGIVLLDGDALPIGGASWVSHLLADPYWTAAFRIVSGSDWIVGRLLRGARDPREPRPSHAQLQRWERPFRVRGTPAAFRQLVGSGGNGVSVQALRRVRVPRLVVWGAHDTVDSVAAGRRTARALRAPFVLVPAAGHLSMLDRPAAVARAIERAAALAG